MSTQETVEAPSGTLSRPPTPGELRRDRLFRGLTRGLAWLTLLAVVFLVFQLSFIARPAVEAHGLKPLADTTWDGKEHFGILPQVWGTVYSSLLGVFLGGLFGVAIAIFLTENFLPPLLEAFFKNVVELLAAIPSVVYGLWGIFVLIPAIRPASNWVHERLGWLPFFDTRLSGPGLLPAALVLAIMILPTVTAISRDALAAVPNKLREAAYGLGATRWEVILAVTVPTAKRGVWGSIILGFGRALGETMALAMLVGNSPSLRLSVFAPADTLAALIANKFPEASRAEMAMLMYAALVLMIITLLVNVLGTWIVTRGGRSLGPAQARKPK
jgi:phosphate transport system permease protein